jgi:hypothetical protein
MKRKQTSVATISAGGTRDSRPHVELPVPLNRSSGNIPLTAQQFPLYSFTEILMPYGQANAKRSHSSWKRAIEDVAAPEPRSLSKRFQQLQSEKQTLGTFFGVGPFSIDAHTLANFCCTIERDLLRMPPPAPQPSPSPIVPTKAQAKTKPVIVASKKTISVNKDKSIGKTKPVIVSSKKKPATTPVHFQVSCRDAAIKGIEHRFSIKPLRVHHKLLAQLSKVEWHCNENQPLECRMFQGQGRDERLVATLQLS